MSGKRDGQGKAVKTPAQLIEAVPIVPQQKVQRGDERAARFSNSVVTCPKQVYVDEETARNTRRVLMARNIVLEIQMVCPICKRIHLI
jgi:hypothetical protein